MKENEFKYEVKITRAYKDDTGYYLVGEASNTDVDLYETVFTEECQRGFVSDIETAFAAGEPLKLESEHKGDIVPFFNFGAIVEATLDNTATKIRARLDEQNPVAMYYWEAVNNPDPMKGRPKQFGLSVNGLVQESHRDYNEQVSKNITYFDRVKLLKVGVVEFAGNLGCYVDAIKRSIKDQEDNSVSVDVTRNDEPASAEETQVAVEVAETQVAEETVNETVQEATQEETTEAEVVEENTPEVNENGEQEEASEATASEERPVEEAEVGSDQGSEEEGQEEVVSTEITNDEPTDENSGDVQRGALTESLREDELNEELRELDCAFENEMWRLRWSIDSYVDRANAIRDLTSEYAELVAGIVNSYTAKREINTSDAAIQTEDLSEEITQVRSLKDVLSQRVSRSAKTSEELVKRELEKEKQMSKELEEKVEALTRSVEALVETTASVKAQNEELVKRNEELAAEPASTPAALVETPAQELPKANPIAEALDRGDTLGAIKLGFGITKQA